VMMMPAISIAATTASAQGGAPGQRASQDGGAQETSADALSSGQIGRAR